MTTEQFKLFWATYYPASIPISGYLRHDYDDRWFRIHSLPESKRYAENEEEWNILLHRQNKMITDLFGDHSTILLISGEYELEDTIQLHPLEVAKSLVDISFIQLEHIDLHQLNPEEHEKGMIYKPVFSEQIWQTNKFDDLLRAIATDELRAFFISEKNNCIAAPYDGGIDFIVKDTATRDSYKQMYKDWLSDRKDGL